MFSIYIRLKDFFLFILCIVWISFAHHGTRYQDPYVICFLIASFTDHDTDKPIAAKSVTNDPKSFASDSVRKRWPVILVRLSIIDDD